MQIQRPSMGLACAGVQEPVDTEPYGPLARERLQPQWVQKNV